MKKMKIIPTNKNKIYTLLHIFLKTLVNEQDIFNILSHLELEGECKLENINFSSNVQDFEDMKDLYDVLPFFLNDKERFLTVVFSYISYHYNSKISLSPTSLARKGQSIKVNSTYVRFYNVLN